MKYIDERKPNTVDFEKIKTGQVFFVHEPYEYGENPYMKIVSIEDSDYDELNAVDLIDGQVVYVEKSTKVVECNSCLKIY